MSDVVIYTSDGFIDAQAHHVAMPQIEIPSNKDLAAIQAGTIVKICENRERFWVIIFERQGNQLIGEVNNHLTNEHSFKCGDLIQFDVRNVYCVHPNRVQIIMDGKRRKIKQ